MKRKSILLDQQTIDRVSALVEDMDRSFSYVVRQMVLKGVEELEQKISRPDAV